VERTGALRRIKMMSNKALLKVTKREEILKQYKKFMRRKVFFTFSV